MGIAPAFPLRCGDESCQKRMDADLDLSWYWGSLDCPLDLVLGAEASAGRSPTSLSASLCHCQLPEERGA